MADKPETLSDKFKATARDLARDKDQARCSERLKRVAGHQHVAEKAD